jgi:hypothetical protein
LHFAILTLLETAEKKNKKQKQRRKKMTSPIRADMLEHILDKIENKDVKTSFVDQAKVVIHEKYKLYKYIGNYGKALSYAKENFKNVSNKHLEHELLVEASEKFKEDTNSLIKFATQTEIFNEMAEMYQIDIEKRPHWIKDLVEKNKFVEQINLYDSMKSYM